MNADSPLSADEAGVFIKYLLLAGLDSAEIRYWRIHRHTDAGIAYRLQALLSDIAMTAATRLEAVPGIDWESLGRSLETSAYYRRRIIDLALEAVLSEPLAPELCVKSASTSSDEISAALPGTWHHAVIFASSICFSHELYPLIVDACVHDSERFGNPRINVLAAHSDWLSEQGQLTRILYLDFSSGRFIETDLDVPIKPDSVQFLCLGREEREMHAAMSQSFVCVQVNPVPVSQLADNKAATLAAWSALGLDVPAYQEIALGDWAAAYCFLDRYTEIVAKPNQATEGELVAFFRRGQAHARRELARHLECCWAQGSAIVQQRRDGVCFRNPVSGVKQSLALRLNLAFDVERHRVESGYAQLGRDERHPAACGRGGQLVAIDEVLSGLTSGDTPIRLDAADWNRICEQAERAAGLFDGLLLMGLDVLLDRDPHGNISPVILEANPRPAGLSHSRLLAGDPFMPAQIGVSLKLWGCLPNSPNNSHLTSPS